MTAESVVVSNCSQPEPRADVQPHNRMKAVSVVKENLQEPEKETQRKDSESVEATRNLLDAVEDKFSMLHDVDLSFSIHKDSGRTIVRIIENETGDVVRQIPSEELLDLAAKLDDMIGILFDERA